LGKYIFFIIAAASISYPQFVWEKLNEPWGGSAGNLFVKGDTVITTFNNNIYFSTNGGEDWTRSDGKVKSDVINYAMTNDSVFFAVTYYGLLKSYNLLNWESSFPIYCYGMTSDIYGRLYLLNGHAYSSTELIGSQNEGKTWYHIKTIPGGTRPLLMTTDKNLFMSAPGIINRKELGSDKPWEEFYFPGRGQIKLSNDGTNTIYGISQGNSYLLFSPDEGETWREIKMKYLTESLRPVNISFFDNNIILAGWTDISSGYNLFLSNDGGFTWVPSLTGIPTSLNIKNVSNDGENFYISLAGYGIIKSTDKGHSWKDITSGVSEPDVKKLLQTKEGDIYAAVWGRGLLKSSDEGNSWSDLKINLNDYKVLDIIKTTDGSLFASYRNYLLRYSPVSGSDEWVQIYNPVVNSGSLFADGDNNIYLLTSAYVYKSSDLGITWNLMFNSGKTFSITENQKGDLYLSARSDQYISVYKSTNKGQTWTKRYTYTKFIRSSFINVDSRGNLFFIAETELLKSSDDGQSWRTISVGNPDMLKELYIHKDKYFITTTTGGIKRNLFYSEDEGETWIQAAGNLEFNSLNNILFTEKNILLAANNGIWRNEVSLTSDNYDIEIPDQFNLNQNYPNPFNPSTTIAYSIPERSRVVINIYDCLGRKVKNLMAEDKETGRYKIRFNAEGLPSGIYFYQLQAGNYQETRKMTLIR
jgi:photosystem II stability/assembly factor-like uncharacterized protein